MGSWKSFGKRSLSATKRLGTITYKSTAFTAKKAYENRKKIAGIFTGTLTATFVVLRDASGHLVSKESINLQKQKVEMQSQRYNRLTARFNNRLQIGSQRKAMMLDTLAVGGETLAAYINSGHMPEEIQQAYELAYPNVAAARSFADQIERLDGQELIGFVSGVKGKLFELQYVEYLNNGHLPEGFHAELAGSPTNPGWDIAIIGQNGELQDTIQAKATDSTTYVKSALEMNPQIDVVTTSEVHSHLIMQGISENLTDSGISEVALTAEIEGAMDGVTASMDWMPSVVLFALIAFSAYNQENLSEFQKGRQFGERSLKSYLAYLVGGSLAVATNTWWIGLLGGMGSRYILGDGHQKLEQRKQLKQFIHNNEVILQRLEQQLV